MKTYSRRKLVRDLSGICRLCLSRDGDRRCIFMNEEDIPLSVKIMTCASVQVSEGDGMPSEICYNCVHQLESLYKFKQKCEEADIKLRKLLKGAKDVETNQQEFHESDCITAKRNVFKLQTDQSKPMEKSTTLFVCSPPNHNNSELSPTDIFSVNKTLHSESSGSITIDCKSSCSSIYDLSDLLIKNVHNSLYNTSQVHTNIAKCALEISERQQLDNSLNKMETCSGCKVDHQGDSTGDIHSKPNSDQNFQNSLEPSQNLQNFIPSDTESKPCIFSPTLNNEEMAADLLGGNKAHIRVMNLVNVSNNVSDYKLIFKCDKCPKRFSKRLDLKRHTSVHNQQRGFVCEVCEKWCPNLTNFKRHERTHTGERPFPCKYCSKSFSQSAILNRHLMTHTGEKPFKCDTCGKKFTQKVSLKVHSRLHSSDSDITTYHYKCPFCEKSFCHQSGLSRHLVTHMGKTFACKLCPKTFTDQSSLKRHVKRHIEIKS